jgi:hypothetical protein
MTFNPALDRFWLEVGEHYTGTYRQTVWTALRWLPTVIGPVCRQAIDELDGSTNQFPFDSLSIRPRLNRLMWELTPCTFGSGTASITMLLPVQSFRNWPTSSAAA